MQLINYVFKKLFQGKRLWTLLLRTSGNQKQKMNAVEGVRDVISRILMVAANSKAEFDLRHLLRYSITTVPLSLANSDWTPLKTDKAVFTKNKQSVLKKQSSQHHCNIHWWWYHPPWNYLRHSRSTCNNGMCSVEKSVPKSWRQYAPGIR